MYLMVKKLIRTKYKLIYIQNNGKQYVNIYCWVKIIITMRSVNFQNIKRSEFPVTYVLQLNVKLLIHSPGNLM